MNGKQLNIGPYQTNHFIFLGICIICIIGVLLFAIKKKLSLRTLTFFMLVVSIISEIIKMIHYIEPTYSEYGLIDGGVLDKEALPFHMCSIQIFLIIIVLITKNQKLKNTLLAFIYPTGFMGATMSLLIPTIDIEFTSLLTYQYFLYHAFLIAFGLYIQLSKEVEINFKSYVKTSIILTSLFMCSIWINSLLSDSVNHLYTNFFFSSKPPIEGLPYLNMNQGWPMYILKVIILGIILVTLVHVPFFIKEYRSRKISNSKQKVIIEK